MHDNLLDRVQTCPSPLRDKAKRRKKISKTLTLFVPQRARHARSGFAQVYRVVVYLTPLPGWEQQQQHQPTVLWYQRNPSFLGILNPSRINMNAEVAKLPGLQTKTYCLESS